MKSGEAPAAPNYNELIPLQTQANKDQFNYALGASRADTQTPYGSSTWSSTPTFDQAGFDEATAKWQASGTPSQENGIWRPGTDAGWVVQEAGDGSSSSWQEGTGGHWEFAPGMQNGTGPMPTREQFTTNDWTNTQTLSPEQQQLYERNVQSQRQQAGLLSALTGRVGESTSQPLDFSSLPGLTGSISPTLSQGPRDYNAGNAESMADVVARLKGLDPNGFNTNVSDALYGQATRYLTPQQDRERQLAEGRLGEQGFVPGTPAYTSAMGDIRKTQDMALADARDRSVLAGEAAGGGQFQRAISQIMSLMSAQGQGFNQERQMSMDEDQVSRDLFGQQQASGIFGNQSRNQAISELLAKRQYPLNELNAMRSGTAVTNPTLKSEYSVPNLAGVDQIGARENEYAGNMGAYNAGVQGDNATMGTILSLIGTAVGAPWLGALVTGLGSTGSTGTASSYGSNFGGGGYSLQ